jgi:hypothetical protein
MSEINFDEWLELRVNELLNSQINCGNNYDEEVIREYLIFLHYKEGLKLVNFFKKRKDDEALFKILIKILLDESEDFSNDARYSVAYLIPGFDEIILKKYKKHLIYAQNYSIAGLKPFIDNNIPNWLMK